MGRPIWSIMSPYAPSLVGVNSWLWNQAGWSLFHIPPICQWGSVCFSFAFCALFDLFVSAKAGSKGKGTITFFPAIVELHVPNKVIVSKYKIRGRSVCVCKRKSCATYSCAV